MAPDDGQLFASPISRREHGLTDRTPTPTGVPTAAVDLFGDDVLADPYEHYRALRELGPVVWLEAHDVYALPRYAEVREALGDEATFCSGQGVGLNDFINQGGQGTTLMSDGDVHDRQREVIGQPLTPRRSPPCGPMSPCSRTRLSTGSSSAARSTPSPTWPR